MVSYQPNLVSYTGDFRPAAVIGVRRLFDQSKPQKWLKCYAFNFAPRVDVKVLKSKVKIKFSV